MNLTFPLQLLCLVGEAFDEYSDLVCGTVVQIRPKMDKLAVWTGNAKEQQANVTIGYDESI